MTYSFFFFITVITRTVKPPMIKIRRTQTTAIISNSGNPKSLKKLILILLCKSCWMIGRHILFYLFLLLKKRTNAMKPPTMRMGPPHTTRQKTTWGQPMPLSGSIHPSWHRST
jgi:hypothetical protein